MNDFYYSKIDLVNQSAVMRINGEIGNDVFGQSFSDELKAIENLGILDIDIWINSPGGNVFEAYNIYTSILKSKANITTYCYGVAASSASWIFLAGKSCVMADFAVLMIHNPSSSDSSSKGQEVLEMMKNSIVTILAKRTGNSPEKVAAMMDEETWFDASTALENGFATSIEETQLLVSLQPATQTVNMMYAISNSAIKNKLENMTEDKVEIVEEVENSVQDEVTVEDTIEVADEVEATDDTVEVTDEVEEVKEVTEDKVAEITNKITLDFTNQITNYKNRITELEAEITSLKDVENKRVEDEKVKAGEELVCNAVKTGKIEAKAKEEWLNMAITNFNLAKSTLDALKVNAPVIDYKNLIKAGSDEKIENLRELEKNNPDKVKEIYNNNRALYSIMFKEAYGVDFKE